ncbi:MAG TPA: hypothetical protein VNI20_00850, partial [Fimbriimonadaceae bacterium]|nr:hypothetical protein [Fimbriimonadaceae bacterium]
LSRVYFDDSYSQYDVLAVLGALTKSQHQQANEGGAIFTMRQLPSRAAIALRSLVAQKVRYPEVSSVDTSYVDTEETKAFAGDARRALRLPEDARFVIRVETKRLLYGMINADAPYAQPNRWSPETVAQTEYYVSNDPDMGALKFGFLATEPAVVYISVLDSGREVPIAAFIMPTMYEGDSFEPMSKMPDWVKQGYEEGKKHVKKLPPSP